MTTEEKQSGPISSSEPAATSAAATYLAAVRGLAPLIAADADRIEQERRLTQPVVDGLVNAGLFRMLVPASLGGGEIDLISFGEVIEEVAKVDGSTAWCLCQGAGAGQIAGCIEEQAARDVFGDPRTVVAWGPGGGTVTVVEGGYRLTGQWSFASGCHHATWLGGQGKVVNQDGSPHLREDGSPEMRRLLFPAACAEIADVWHVSGLRGTGSDSYSVKDLFVRQACSYPCGPTGLPLAGPRREPGPLYAFPLTAVYATGFSSLALGTARAALDAFVDLAAVKKPQWDTSLLRDDAAVQLQVARDEASLRAARAFLHASVRDARASATAGEIPLEQRVLVRLATTSAIHAAAKVVDHVYYAAGATAIFESNPFERRFRDIHAVTQQAQGSQSNFKSAGQFFLGLEIDTGHL